MTAPGLSREDVASLARAARELRGASLPTGADFQYWSLSPAFSSRLSALRSRVDAALASVPDVSAPPGEDVLSDPDDLADWTADALEGCLERADAALAAWEAQRREEAKRGAREGSEGPGAPGSHAPGRGASSSAADARAGGGASSSAADARAGGGASSSAADARAGGGASSSSADARATVESARDSMASAAAALTLGGAIDAQAEARRGGWQPRTASAEREEGLLRDDPRSGPSVAPPTSPPREASASPWGPSSGSASSLARPSSALSGSPAPRRPPSPALGDPGLAPASAPASARRGGQRSGSSGRLGVAAAEEDEEDDDEGGAGAVSFGAASAPAPAALPPPPPPPHAAHVIFVPSRVVPRRPQDVFPDGIDNANVRKPPRIDGLRGSYPAAALADLEALYARIAASDGLEPFPHPFAVLGLPKGGTGEDDGEEEGEMERTEDGEEEGRRTGTEDGEEEGERVERTGAGASKAQAAEKSQTEEGELPPASGAEGSAGAALGAATGVEKTAARDALRASSPSPSLSLPSDPAARVATLLSGALASHPWWRSSAPPLPPRHRADTPFSLVDTEAGLAALCARLSGASVLAIDLEAHNERSFRGFCALVQVSSRDEDAVVDALALRGCLGRHLGPLLASPRVLKVFHGAGMDVTWLQRDFGAYVCPLFDTAEAARAAGMPSAALASLLEAFCGEPKDCSFQRYDWRIRPLRPRALEYARGDTHSLLYVADVLKQRLRDLGPDAAAAALAASAKVAARLSELDVTSPVSFLRFLGKDAVTLDRKRLPLARELYNWRDDVCRKADEGVGHVLSRAALLKLVRNAPVDAWTALLERAQAKGEDEKEDSRRSGREKDAGERRDGQSPPPASAPPVPPPSARVVSPQALLRLLHDRASPYVARDAALLAARLERALSARARDECAELQRMLAEGRRMRAGYDLPREEGEQHKGREEGNGGDDGRNDRGGRGESTQAQTAATPAAGAPLAPAPTAATPAAGAPLAPAPPAPTTGDAALAPPPAATSPGAPLAAPATAAAARAPPRAPRLTRKAGGMFGAAKPVGIARATAVGASAPTAAATRVPAEAAPPAADSTVPAAPEAPAKPAPPAAPSAGEAPAKEEASVRVESESASAVSPDPMATDGAGNRAKRAASAAVEGGEARPVGDATAETAETAASGAPAASPPRQRRRTSGSAFGSAFGGGKPRLDAAAAARLAMAKRDAVERFERSAAGGGGHGREAEERAAAAAPATVSADGSEARASPSAADGSEARASPSAADGSEARASPSAADGSEARASPSATDGSSSHADVRAFVASMRREAAEAGPPAARAEPSAVVSAVPAEDHAWRVAGEESSSSDASRPSSPSRGSPPAGSASRGAAEGDGFGEAETVPLSLRDRYGDQEAFSAAGRPRRHRSKGAKGAPGRGASARGRAGPPSGRGPAPAAPPAGFTPAEAEAAFEARQPSVADSLRRQSKGKRSKQARTQGAKEGEGTFAIPQGMFNPYGGIKEGVKGGGRARTAPTSGNRSMHF